jgi:hypothetical protein
MVKYIGTDEEVAQVQAHQPMQQTPDFIRAMYRMLGQPFDMPLEVIAKDMSTCNFARPHRPAAVLPQLPHQGRAVRRRWSRTIRWWLSRERTAADGDPKKWKTPFPENYWNHELLVNAWDYTDPVSEAQATCCSATWAQVAADGHRRARPRRREDPRERQEWAEKTKDLPDGPTRR